MIKSLALVFIALSLCSCVVRSYDPYYISAPSSIYVAPSIYSGYGYTHTTRNYYLRPYTVCNDHYRYRNYMPSYNQQYRRNRH